ncbi:MAG TPA: hemerythrin domain-containing protein [Actinomycetota bacterium]|nr:hemerythrin domain-containing protein [Actinomycetota bacterium]
MKRDEALFPLTHDHHHALGQARRLRGAADAELPERAAQAREFLSFFAADTIAHFREEEELIFPLVIDEPAARATITRLLLEHVKLHALVTELRAELVDAEPTTETMSSIAALLQHHIRLEEKVFFPLVEDMARDVLSAVELGPRRRATATNQMDEGRGAIRIGAERP